jgi:probable rRNA maturation factor
VSPREAERLARGVLRAEGVAQAALSVAFIGRRRMRTLHRVYRGADRDTDVLAFALAGHGDARSRGPGVVGDVYVCVPVGIAQARRFGVTPADELRRLLVHGVLHVLGYDHPDGPGRTSGAMWRRQERLLARLARRR